MNDAQGFAPAIPVALSLLPSGRLLVDAEYLYSEVMREAAQRQQPGSANTSDDDAFAPHAMLGGGMNGRPGSFVRVAYSGVLRDRPVQQLTDVLRALYADRDVSGIILALDTGGGSVTSAELLRDAIRSRNKPVVVHTNYLASGGVMGTLDADEIVALSRSTVVGSIGVVQQIATFMRDFLNRYFAFEYADTSPEKNASTREFLRTGDTSVYRPLLNELDALFMAEVAANRPLNAALRESTLAGGTWLAEEAQRRGLIDGIGGTNYVITRLAEAVANYS